MEKPANVLYFKIILKNVGPNPADPFYPALVALLHWNGHASAYQLFARQRPSKPTLQEQHFIKWQLY